MSRGEVTQRSRWGCSMDVMNKVHSLGNDSLVREDNVFGHRRQQKERVFVVDNRRNWAKNDTRMR